jgi:hypothetical protein
LFNVFAQTFVLTKVPLTVLVFRMLMVAGFKSSNAVSARIKAGKVAEERVAIQHVYRKCW